LPIPPDLELLEQSVFLFRHRLVVRGLMPPIDRDAGLSPNCAQPLFCGGMSPPARKRN
jgi:hypothetical protein